MASFSRWKIGFKKSIITQVYNVYLPELSRKTDGIMDIDVWVMNFSAESLRDYWFNPDYK